MKLLLPVDIPRRTITRWFLVVLAIKLSWLVLFTLLRNPHWNPSLEIGAIGLYTGDSKTYYKPLEYLIQTGTYYGACRMPGLLPVYLPLRLWLSPANAQQAIVILQVLMESISCIALAILGARIFNSAKIFGWILLLSCITTFVTVRNIYLLSESFCVAALILVMYFLSNYFLYGKKAQLVYAGIFITWAIFLRQISVVALPILGMLLIAHHGKDFRQVVRASLILALPLVMAISAWAIRNRITYERTIILTPPLEECMHNYTVESAAIRNLIITLGEDFQPWSRNGGAYWFFMQSPEKALPTPFNEHHFTSVMGHDELVALRYDFRRIESDTLPQQTADSLRKTITERCKTYVDSYQQEHRMAHLIGNKFKFARMFLFPNRIDDLPFPPMNEMNILQKGIKLWSLVSLWLVNGLACLIALWWLYKKQWSWLLWCILPLLFPAGLIYFGFIEQRYLATSFPFFLLMIAGCVLHFRTGSDQSTLGKANH
jgi:hypothetical protein